MRKLENYLSHTLRVARFNGSSTSANFLGMIMLVCIMIYVSLYAIVFNACAL